MWCSGRTRVRCVAIDIGQGAVKLMASSAGQRLLAVKRVPWVGDDDAQQVAALQQACPASLPRSCRVVVALHEPVMSKQLTIAQPLTSAAALLQLREDAAHHFNHSLAEHYVDVERLPATTSHSVQRMRLVAAKRCDVDRLVALLAQAELRVTHVDVAQFALVAALRRTLSIINDVIVIEVHQQRIQLGVLTNPVGDEQWRTHALTGKEHHAALLEQVVVQLQSLISDSQPKKIQTLVLISAHVEQQLLCEQIAKRTGYACVAVNPLTTIAHDLDLEQQFVKSYGSDFLICSGLLARC